MREFTQQSVAPVLGSVGLQPEQSALLSAAIGDALDLLENGPADDTDGDEDDTSDGDDLSD